MDEQDKINELVDIIDKLMSDGGNRVNVITDNSYDDGTINVHTTNCSDCCCTACNIPNLNVGIDDEKDE